MHNEKIIVVDDEKRMCDSLSTLLVDDGYRVDTYQDSFEAAQAIRAGDYELVITDIKMPQVDGLELLSIVKEVDADVPVILMTGYASLDSAVEAISKGAYDYLLKPVEFTHLQLAVNRALEKRRSDRYRLKLVEELRTSNETLKRRMSELNALYQAGKSIGSTANLQELLRQIVSLAARVTESQVGSIMLLDDKREFLTIEAAIGLEKEIVANTRLPIGESIAGWVAESGEPLIVGDVEHDDRFQRINKEKYGAASLLCVPLKIKNGIIGVVNMANKQHKQRFTRNDLMLLSTFASQAAVAVDDAHQFEEKRRRLAEFEILHELSAELPNIESVEDFREKLVDRLTRLFQIDYSIWFNWDRQTKALVVNSVSGLAEIPLTKSGKIDISRIDPDNLALKPFEEDEICMSDAAILTLSITEKMNGSRIFPESPAALMAIPILKYGELAHVFCLAARSGEPYSLQDVSLAKLVISQASLLFEKERSLLNATRLMTMGNMISEISHDLRRPLTSIKGGLQIIRQRHPNVADNSELFSTLEEEVQRINELVRELVDFSNPNRYATEKLDMKAVVYRAAELVGPDLRKKQIEFSAEFDEADWNVIVNKNQFLEVLLNLYINAIDAMSDGGTLSVKGLIEKPDHKKTDYLALRITDTGTGIKKENLSRIFDRYHTTKKSGTGLGLPIVERIISAHNGTLSVESVEGEGTVFTVYLPYSGGK